MRNCVFTICAKNYIGLALVLEKSIKQYNQECDFYIFVADELPQIERASLPDNVIVAKTALIDSIPNELWEEMAFKYNLTEFCTSIKPFCFQYLFNHFGAEKAIYLDPDILTFSSFEPIFSQLDGVSIILTPHITSFEKEYLGERSEKGLLSTGVYNLGFLALRKCESSLGMLTWWGERLKNECYIEPLDSYFTDQRWMDFLPCFFDSDNLLVSKHLGLNVAPWNFFERKVSVKDGYWVVNYRNQNRQNRTEWPLVFVHFSGYDYKSLIQGKVVQNNIAGLGFYEDIESMCQTYADFLVEEINTFNSYIKHSYTYNTFINGVSITNFQRRIFRGLIEEGAQGTKPFEVDDNTFYSHLIAKKLINVNNSSIALDKINKATLSGASSKLKKINSFMRIFFKIVGLNNYTLMLRLLRPYSRIENHLHLFDSKYSERLK